MWNVFRRPTILALPTLLKITMNLGANAAMLGANRVDKAAISVFTIFGLKTRAASTNYAKRMLSLRERLEMLLKKESVGKLLARGRPARESLVCA